MSDDRLAQIEVLTTYLAVDEGKTWENRVRGLLAEKPSETVTPASEATPVSASERAVLEQTIEMFEEIAKTGSNDIMMLETLVEAYNKLGKSADTLATWKRLVEAHLRLGNRNTAESEAAKMLKKYPNDPNALAFLRQATGDMAEIVEVV